MSNKSRKFKSNNKSNSQVRVVRRARFDQNGHLIKDKRIYQSMARLDVLLQPENSAVLERNLEEAINFTNTEFVEEVEETLFRDNELADAFGNTIVVNDANALVNDEAQKSAYRSVIHVAIDDATRAVIENENESFTKETFVQRVKKDTFSRLNTLRHEAEKIAKEAKEESSSFFDKVRNKFNKINVNGRNFINMFETAKADMKHYAQKISDNAPSVKSKVLANKWQQFRMKVTTIAVVTFGALAISCSNGNTAPQVQKQNDTTQIKANKPKVVKKVKTSTAMVEKVKKQYSDSTSISVASLKSTIKFDNNSFTHKLNDSTIVKGYDFAMQRLTDNVMAEHFDSLYREQVLNAHRYIRSNYPNPERLSKLGIKDSTIIEAAQAAKEFDCFLNGDTDKVPEKIATMFEVEQVRGTLNRYATGIKNPCDENTKVQYKNIKTFEQTPDTTAVDTTAVQNTFDDIPSNLDIKNKTVTQESNVSVQNSLLKSNEGFKNSKTLRSATNEEMVDRVAKDKKVLKENEQTTFDDVANETQTDSVTLNKGNNLSDGKPVKKVGTAEAAGVQLKDQKVAMAQRNSAQTDFDDVADTSKTEQKNVNVQGQSDKASSSELSSAGNDVETKVVLDSDSVKIGTPSAGYVPERGGVNNSGVTPNQIKTAKAILGEDVYQAIIDNSPEEWFNKGGIAGGLTREQFAVDVSVMNQTGPNKETTTAIMEAINCGKKMSAEIETKVKADIDGIHINRTRDGWVYKDPIYVRKVNNNGCGKKRTLDQVRTENRKPTKASGPKFPRMFRLTLVMAQTAFDDLASTLEIKQNKQIVTQDPDIALMKSNENFENSKQKRDATVDEVINRQAKDKKVMTENMTTVQSSGEQTGFDDISQTESNIAKKKASIIRKRTAKLAQRYQKQAKEAGLTGNMALDKFDEKGLEFVQNFVKTNKTKAEDIIQYQTNAVATVRKAKSNAKA